MAAFSRTFPTGNMLSHLETERRKVFVTSITLQNVGIPLDEKYKIEVQGLFQEFALLNSEILRKGQVRIEHDSMSFTIHRVLRKVEVIREILSVLSTVADRIESAPIV